MTFSVIIPTLNEEEHIRAAIRSVRAAALEAEIIVVDGGSTDETATIVREEGAAFYLAPRGRGIQLNHGALHSGGDILVFLHADTIVASDLFEILKSSFRNAEVLLGTCTLQFDVAHPLLRFYAACARVKSIFTTFGDQCIVVRKSFLEKVGGFPAWRLFEDVRLLERARVRTRIHTFPSVVITSSRKFVDHGVIRQQIRNALFVLLYVAGVSPHRLAIKYSLKAQRSTGTKSTVSFNHKRREELCEHSIG